MEGNELSRVQSDLNVIRQAAGDGLPFGREDVHASLWFAAGGALIVIWACLTSWDFRWVVLAFLGMAGIGLARSLTAAYRQRSTQPVRWRENRVGIQLGVMGGVLAVGYVGWEMLVGTPAETRGAASVFFVGGTLLLFAFTQYQRLYLLGVAIPLIAFGMAIPFCQATQEVRALAGVAGLIGGVLTAAIQSWQLRAEGQQLNGGSHATD